MQALLTFIIPVRHPHNSKNWEQLKDKLTQAIKSISLQTGDGWRAVIVANQNAALPELPPGFDAVRVDFPPNPLSEQGSAAREVFHDAIRIDKGRRILAGMLHARQTDYFMVVDDDDFVSKRLTQFVSGHKGATGWYFKNGYVWSDGGKLLFKHTHFSKLCGTSHIIRADLFNLPASFAEASDSYIRKMLGSHIFINDHLRDAGTPLAPLPFPGAVYRIGHANSHSKSADILHSFFLKKKTLLNPLRLLLYIFRLRYITTGLRQEFFG